MLGPMLHQEMMLGGRRNRLYVFRWVYAGWLIVVLLGYFLVFLSEEVALAQVRRAGGDFGADRHASAPEVVGSRFADFFAWQQVLFLFLAVPVFTAGAVIDEKREGTLQYLLLSDLEPRHILLGKLLARMAQVALWLLAGLPLFALMAGFGGVEPRAMLYFFLGSITPVFAVASLSVLASVWCHQTRDAVLAVYLLLGVGWGCVYLIGGPFSFLNPLWVFEPVWTSTASAELREATRRLIASGVIWTFVGLASFGAATASLTAAYRAELEGLRPERAQWYSTEREPIDSEPIRWREQHVEGLAINATLRRVPRWLSVGAVAMATTVASLAILYNSLIPGANVADALHALLQLNVNKVTSLMPQASEGFLVLGVVVMLTASQAVGARCAGAITQERERRTWEAVLLTPMTARQIVSGKLWGILLASAWYLLAYAAPAICFSTFAGPLALMYTLTWLAATMLAMYFIGAVGIWCSVRASSSWRGLLQMEFIGYLGGLAAYCVCSPVIYLIGFLLVVVVLFLDLCLGTKLVLICMSKHFMRMFVFASTVFLVVSFWVVARLFLNRAQRWIADRERTRHRVDEPIYRRSRGSSILKGDHPW